jgi:hypothetical protein
MNRASTVRRPVPYPAPRPLGVTGGARCSPTAERNAPDRQHHGAGTSVNEGVTSAPVLQPGLGGGTEDGRC